ncbi:non-ribosomal peptide synthetase [Streptomyces tateyamensis]|uniref:non-ribosomal peptide synthetase n=1 Tax=Streptomyces tateyamensis TaxID=565073 RepID=UPI0015E8DB79|nr:non-ribosomal peptide synthetase [Streptomyces tateyamensis]
MPTVPELVAARAAADPHRPALVQGERELTYGDLLDWADTVAAELRAGGVSAGSRVAVLCERSIEYAVAALGVLRAGACYLPVDPAYPAERRELMLGDAEVARVLDAAAVTAARTAAPARRPEAAPPSAPTLAAQPAPSALPAPAADDLAYVVYTSGSTGRPKGVAVEHASLLNLVTWVHTAFAPGPGDRAPLLSAVGFDASVLELWPYLTAGATVVVATEHDRSSPARLRDFLVDSGVTLAFAPTPLAEALTALPWPATTALRTLLTGGDRLTARPPRGLPFTLVDNYGPAESTVIALSAPVPPGDGPPTIGRPLPGITAVVRDAAGAGVADGEVGELYLGGAGLARGYLGRPELTAERFTAAPTAGRLYRTGDLVRRRPDGEFEFVGRADDQVQIRGFRVEPGELEAALGALPGVRAAAVVAGPDATGEPCLRAFYVPAPDGPAPDAVRRALATRLPAHLLPAAVQALDALPLTGHGKTDRSALLARSAGERVPGAPPRTPTEALLVDVWSQVFGFRVGVDEPFDELGGHSLRAMRILARIAERCGVEPAPADVLGGRTVAELARTVDELARAVDELARAVEELTPTADGPARNDDGDAPTADGPARNDDGDAPTADGPARNDDGHAPLASAQARYWFIDQFAPDPAISNVSIGLTVTADPRPTEAPAGAPAVDERALAESIAELVRRHPALRTAYVQTPQGPRARVLPWTGTTAELVETLDLRGAPGTAAVRFAQQAARPFDLTRPPLLRAVLARTAEACWEIGLTIHHIAVDGRSVEILLADLAEVYPALAAHRAPAERPAGPDPAAVARWEQSRLDRHPDLLEYWTRALDGAPPLLDLTPGETRPPQPSFRGATVGRRLPTGLRGTLDRTARRLGATPYMVLLAGLLTVLHRYTGQRDLVVGTPVGDRPQAAFESTVGCFVNTLPLRVDLAGDPGFAELVDRVRAVTTEAYAYRALPFERLVEKLAPTGRRAHHPLFQVMLVLQQIEATELRLPGATVRFDGELPADRARFDLTVVLDRDRLAVEYATDLFDAAFAERLADHLVRVLTAAGADPAIGLDRIELLSDAEREQVLAFGRGAPARRPGPVHDRIAGPPGRPAVVCEDESLDYAELDAAVNGLARVLVGYGLPPGTPVAVCLPRSVRSVVAMIAVHRAGGVYVPMDPAFPDERLRQLLADAAPPLAVCTGGPGGTADRLRALAAGPLTAVDARQPDAGTPPTVRLGEDDVADIMFTSGSTGRPKGVLLTHGGLANLVAAKVELFDVRPDSTVLQFVAFGFSVSISDVYMTLTTGATLVVRGDAELAGEDLAELIRRHAVTNLVLPASVLAAVPDTDLPSVRAITVGGEACSAALVDRWAPGRHFVNAYGPTEATTATAVGVCAPGGGRPTVGRPIPGALVYLLDERGRPVPIGVPGELYVGGAGVGRGYLGRPGLTAERFLPDPFAGGRMYRTGDLARWLPDGAIALLGRNDDQVNVRGARLEIGDVEAALRAHPAVADAAAAVQRHPVAGERLVGYLVPKADTPTADTPSADTPDGPAALPAAGPLTVPAVRAFLADRLPGHAVPTAFLLLPALPRTSTGKLDRRALPDPGDLPGQPGGRRAPSGPIEEILVEIWTEVLGAEPGVDDDFFAIGGQSLLAAAVAARIRDRFEIPFPVRVLFDEPTIAALAGAVEKAIVEDLG